MARPSIRCPAASSLLTGTCPCRRRRRNDKNKDKNKPPSCDGCCPPGAAGVGSEVDLFNGELSEQFELPQLYSLNDAWVPEFVYRSRRAWPQFFIPIDSAIEGVASVPDAIAYQNLIDDVAVGSEIYVDTRHLHRR